VEKGSIIHPKREFMAALKVLIDSMEEVIALIMMFDKNPAENALLAELKAVLDKVKALIG
jgi:hypothetical protein